MASLTRTSCCRATKCPVLPGTRALAEHTLCDVHVVLLGLCRRSLAVWRRSLTGTGQRLTLAPSGIVASGAITHWRRRWGPLLSILTVPAIACAL